MMLNTVMRKPALMLGTTKSNERQWQTPSDIKAQYRSASILKGGRVVFNIAGNKYRLIVWVNYVKKTVYICFVGTHKQYDKIDAETV